MCHFLRQFRPQIQQDGVKHEMRMPYVCGAVVVVNFFSGGWIFQLIFGIGGSYPPFSLVLIEP